jgi:sec-independent protein translocase protein TatA
MMIYCYRDNFMGYENVLIIIMLVGLVLFGSKRLPELARAIGRSQMEFEMARSEATKEAQKEILGRDLASGDIGSDVHHRLYRVKLEKAALRAGVQDPTHLTDEELVHAVNLYLEE